MNRHPIFSHRSRWGRICAFGRGGWIFTWEIQSAIKNQFPDEKALTAYYGACDTDGWLEEIRKNIRAALAEKPEYLVWHVADCTLEEAWTRQFYYTSKDVLRETAAIYNAVSEEVPETVEVLFENIFWPGAVAAFCLLK